MAHEVFAQPSTPVEESIEAGIRFWEWYIGALREDWLGMTSDMKGVLRTAAETVSLYLPETMMDRQTTNTIMKGSLHLALRHDGWLHRERFKRVLGELADDPSKELTDISAGVFADEYDNRKKEELFRLAKLVVQDPPER